MIDSVLLVAAIRTLQVSSEDFVNNGDEGSAEATLADGKIDGG